MRFQRQAKIFRGQLDPAPIAGVFFLLVIFVLLGSMLYTPGVLVELKPGEAATGPVITITRADTILFAGQTYKATELDHLRAELKTSRATQPLQLRVEPGADSKLRDAVRNLLLIAPPVVDSAIAEGIGTENPVAIVAVNLRGQFFFESEMVEEPELRNSLIARRAAALQEGRNLTLLLLQDNGVPTETFVRLSSIASEVGIKEVIIGTRPPPFSTHPESRKP